MLNIEEKDEEQKPYIKDEPKDGFEPTGLSGQTPHTVDTTLLQDIDANPYKVLENEQNITPEVSRVAPLEPLDNSPQTTSVNTQNIMPKASSFDGYTPINNRQNVEQNPTNYDFSGVSYQQNVKKSNKGLRNFLTAILLLLIIALVAFGSSQLTLFYVNQNTLQTFSQNNSSSNKVVNENAPSIDIIGKGQTDTDYPLEEGVVLTAAQVNAKVLPSVVGIQSSSLKGTVGTGTGIIMSEDGYIITNSHVIADGDIFTVYMYDQMQYKAELVGQDEKTDLAIIKIKPDASDEIIPAEFGNSELLVVGDNAYAIGTPGGLELQSTFTGGYISAISREIVIDDREMKLIQTDAAINPGNSGGPLINEYGQVIGINTIKIVDEEYEGLGFAIPINEAKPILDEITTYGFVTGRPAIGITGMNITKEQAEANNIPQGLYVETVDIRSSAYTQGLKKGDIIVGVNGQTTTSSTEINEIRDNFNAGDIITLNVDRAGQKIEIDIALMDENDLSAVTEPQVEEQQIPNNDSNDAYYYNPFGGFFPFG